MRFIFPDNQCEYYDPFDPHTGHEQIYVQLVGSLALGLSGLLGFCFLRPRWKGLYAARKRHSEHAGILPELPDTFFGWIPVLHSVTEDQVIDSAGLDAYVFLAFFKMSIKLFATIFLIAILVLAPINSHFEWLPTFGAPNDQRGNTAEKSINRFDKEDTPDPTYLWAYLVFTYIFTGLAIYFMIVQTNRIIKVRQDYLGRQSTVTDRTFKLSGIPPELRFEGKIAEFIEKLNIGKVERVNIVRNLKKLDELMDQRARMKKKLEEAVWNVYTKRQKPNSGNQFPQEHDTSQLLQGEQEALLGHNQINADFRDSLPKTRVYFGFFKLRSKKVDAIDYYEEKLCGLDEKILTARKKEYSPTPMAFITMDSVSACQIAVQSLIAHLPTHLLASPAPANTDIVWRNTYRSRSSRMIRAWTITMFIIILTVFWVVPVAALAGLLDLCYIRSIFPKFADILSGHRILKSLVQAGLPTLVVSLLNIGVPFLYDFLSNQQGMLSQGDVELSLISKNFFFTFFNVFLTFTVAGTATKLWSALQDSLKDTTFLAFKLAGSVQQLAVFYINFILLQGVGLIPLRLLEIGNVCYYPIMRMCPKSPQDESNLAQPPVFKYGFYLPSAILVYILCIVYSILPAGYMVLFFGVIYFINSYYTYKYQLLYAMDQYHHPTGGAWPMICYRILLGLSVFQIVMAGIIALKNQIYAAGLVVPLIPFTTWYSYYFGRTYHPLFKFIALESIQRGISEDVNMNGASNTENFPSEFLYERAGMNDEDGPEGLGFVNPNYVVPLAKPLIRTYSESSRQSIHNGNGEIQARRLMRKNSVSSSLSLGDTHIWRQSTDSA